jgi:hypothetical protein
LQCQLFERPSIFDRICRDSRSITLRNCPRFRHAAALRTPIRRGAKVVAASFALTKRFAFPPTFRATVGDCPPSRQRTRDHRQAPERGAHQEHVGILKRGD